jgi:UDP-glucose 4-epimerase
MKFLVTGASGFIGQNLVRYLQNTEIEVATCSRGMCEYSKEHYIVDLKSIEDVRNMIIHSQPDVIIHLAGSSAGKPDYKQPSLVFEENISGTNNLIAACELLKFPPKFILASTIVVYGNMTSPDDWLLELSPRNPTTPYGISKLTCEHLVGMYTKQNIINGTSLRLGATVGPNLTHGVVFDFMQKIKNNPENLDVIGRCPGSMKPYTHVDDVINGIMIVSSLPSFRFAYNLCNEDALSIKDLASAVLEGMSAKRSLVWKDINWAGDNPVLRVCSYKMKDIGWKSTSNSYESIVKSVRQNITG